MESEEWTALRKFNFDEAIFIAGISAERRTAAAAREEKEVDTLMVENRNNHQGPRVAGAVPTGSTRPEAPLPEIDLSTGHLTGGRMPFIGS